MFLHDAGSLALGAELAGDLDLEVAGIGHLEGGSELAGWLASVDVGRLGEFDLVEVVAGFERVASWAKARSAAAAAELSQRAVMNPVWPSAVGPVSEPCTAASELSLRLGVSRQAATRLVSTGRLLDGPLSRTGAALDTGSIEWSKALTIADALGPVPWQVALAVEDQVLPTAARRTPTQLARDLQRALAEVDPADAQQRHARAAGTRRVERPRILPDGMASVRAVLPAEAAVRLDATLQGAAVWARAGGERRTVDQLRADALDTMAQTAWETGWIGDPTGRICAGGAPCEAADGAPDTPTGDTTSGQGTSGQGTSGQDADERPGTANEQAPQRRNEGVPPTATDRAVQGRNEGAPAMRVGPVSRRRAQVMVTVGVGTLLGLDERPAHLDGYGPIGADVARRIAQDGTWRRLLVDPPSGTVMDVGRTRYRPPADLAELVRARNPHCVIPTCSVPASRCELDHTVPFDHRAEGGGATSAGNLGPLCRHGHLLKTHAGFRLTQPEPGTFSLRTPTGHEYVQLPPRPPGVPWHVPRAEVDRSPDPTAASGRDPAGPPPF